MNLLEHIVARAKSDKQRIVRVILCGRGKLASHKIVRAKEKTGPAVGTFTPLSTLPETRRFQKS